MANKNVNVNVTGQNRILIVVPNNAGMIWAARHLITNNDVALSKRSRRNVHRTVTVTYFVFITRGSDRIVTHHYQGQGQQEIYPVPRPQKLLVRTILTISGHR